MTARLAAGLRDSGMDVVNATFFDTLTVIRVSPRSVEVSNSNPQAPASRSPVMMTS